MIARSPRLILLLLMLGGAVACGQGEAKPNATARSAASTPSDAGAVSPASAAGGAPVTAADPVLGTFVFIHAQH